MSDAADIAEQVLTEHERTVLRHLRRRGVDSTLSLYRQYRNRESLEAAVRRMAEKVAAARNRPAPSQERDLADVLADMTGMPVGQVLSAGLGRINGAGAPASTPPVTGAPARSPSSPPALPRPARPADPDPQPADDSPAGFERFEPTGTRRHGANTASADRRRRIVELLGEKPRSVKLLEHELGCAPHQVAHDLQVLKGEGKVEPTERSAHDWPGANRSAKASKLYRIPVARSAGPEYGLDTGATPTQAVPIDGTSDSGASDEGANEEAPSQPDGATPTWLCGRCGNGGNLTGVCGRCGAPASERGPFTPPPGIPARDAAKQLAAASARLEQDATPMRVPSLRPHPVELDDSAPPPPGRRGRRGARDRRRSGRPDAARAGEGAAPGARRPRVSSSARPLPDGRRSDRAGAAARLSAAGRARAPRVAG